MNKLLIGLVTAALTVTPAIAGPNGSKHYVGPPANHGHYRPYYGRPYYNNYNYWYWAAPLAIGAVSGYIISNSYDQPQPQLRRDIDGRMYELRNVYDEGCRCTKQMWVQIQ